MSAPKLGILLGDKRQFYMGEIFKQWGYEVYFCGKREEVTEIKYVESFERLLSDCDSIVVPTPFSLSEDKTRQLIGRMQRGQILFSSKIPEKIKRELKRKRVRVCDFLDQEEIAEKNAEITAEGIIAEAMEKRRRMLYQSQCLVIGYGKCAKAIARRLVGLGARVTVCTNCETEKQQARERGLPVVPFEKLIFEMKTKQFVFHTVPVSVISKECFLGCNRELSILDIVSTRMEEKRWAREYGIDYTIYPKIPEKYDPKAAAFVFSECIQNEMNL